MVVSFHRLDKISCTAMAKAASKSLLKVIKARLVGFLAGGLVFTVRIDF